MKNFVFFNNNKMFDSRKIWRVENIISRFRKSEVDLFQFGTIKVKTNTDKEIQDGVIISAENEVDAIDKFENIKKVLYG